MSYGTWRGASCSMGLYPGLFRGARIILGRAFARKRTKDASTANLCGFAGARGLSESRRPLRFEHVIARQGKCVQALSQLKLKDHEVAVTEAHLGPCKIELPHPAEPFVVKRCGLCPILAEARPPFLE